jgi:hypothetical protein
MQWILAILSRVGIISHSRTFESISPLGHRPSPELISDFLIAPNESLEAHPLLCSSNVETFDACSYRTQLGFGVQDTNDNVDNDAETYENFIFVIRRTIASRYIREGWAMAGLHPGLFQLPRDGPKCVKQQTKE